MLNTIGLDRLFVRLKALRPCLSSYGLQSAVIAIFVTWLYWDSLFHIFRMDQICYFYETSGKHSFWEIFQRSYSYNRVRECAPGDMVLFRPLLFTLLSAERWLFGADPLPWQAVGIALHSAVSALLLLVLRQLCEKPVAFVLTVFFASLSIVGDNVIFQHINGYVLFCAMILGAVYHLNQWIVDFGDGKKFRKHFPWVFGLTLLGCFTYELGNAISLGLFLIFVALYWATRERNFKAALVIVAGPIFFQLVNVIDFYDKLGKAPNTADFLKINMMVFAAMYDFVAIVLPWGFYPNEWRYKLGDAVDAEYIKSNMLAIEFAVMAGAALLAMCLQFRRRSLAIRLARQNAPAAVTCVLAIGSLLAYAYMLSAGRLAVAVSPIAPPTEVRYVFATHYAYIFWVLAVLLCASALRTLRPLYSTSPAIRSFAMLSALALLLVCCWQNTGKTRKMNALYRDMLSDARSILLGVNEFVAAHESEPDFSFEICPLPPGVRYNGWSVDVPMVDKTGNRLGEAIYYRQLSHDAKYHLRLRSRLAPRIVASCSQDGTRPTQPFPILKF